MKNRGYRLHIYPPLTHLIFYQCRARQGLISSPTQNAGRVIALSVKTQPVATWLVYTQGCSNNVVLWQAATAIFSPLFIHLLSHLALLVILALTLNQIYHTVRTVSVFILFSEALLLFYLKLSVFLGSFFFLSFFHIFLLMTLMSDIIWVIQSLDAWRSVTTQLLYSSWKDQRSTRQTLTPGDVSPFQSGF